MSDITGYRHFVPALEARFVRRPNRFLIEADAAGSMIRAHCPNPGRMEEFLIPGRPLLFERSGGGARKTAWTAAAVRYRGMVIPLNSGRANRIAEHIVLPALFPEGSLRAEVPNGSSRFDFLLSIRGENTWVEVKTCTLTEYGTAMFPDAPTERGRRHIRHLVQLAAQPGTRAMILFLLMNPETRTFIPNLHTDPAFSLALREASSAVDIRAVSLRTDEEGYVSVANPRIPVDFSYLSPAETDAGVYLLVLGIHEDITITVGSLGETVFRRGWYVYAGSGRKNLSKRISRHLEPKKNLRWHIDYLSAAAEEKKAYPIYTLGDLECPLARDIRRISDESVPGFGCSDCRCDSHLFYFRENPVRTEAFQEVILRYRHREAFVYGVFRN